MLANLLLVLHSGSFEAVGECMVDNDSFLKLSSSSAFNLKTENLELL